ncbi:UDP-2,3-diacylglucosamine diphosphatase [Flavobacteriales bacterium]|nr:UDP-2,3-diacylglucosamine diphosphatase [Flavobacteriales bacterium]MDA9325225.1 UDP-2,3-diacylglucosamine diphosphatase [Flavobacteriales bacterium]
MNNKKIYFASDFHLGSPNKEESRIREKKIISWLNFIEKDAKVIYLLGDIFDFWFEYKKVVPKGFVRLLGKLSELTDNGIDIHYVVGNHDMWIDDYLEQEIGLKLHFREFIINEDDKQIFLGHGDGLGKGDYKYKILKKIFSSNLCKWLFSRLHPNFGIGLGQAWSNKSRKEQEIPINEENEILAGYCKEQQKNNPVDYYVFGHRHIPMEIKIDERANYINLGDWIHHYSYAVYSDKKLELKKF